MDGVIEHADALQWLAEIEPGCATAVVFDPPYAVGTPVRGREDGAAGSVSGPLSFMQRTLSLCARALRPGGIVVIFGDYKRLPDLMYGASTSGLRLSGCVAWVRPGPAPEGCSARAGTPYSSPREGRRTPSTGQRSGT
jgi:DNA modification methylase